MKKKLVYNKPLDESTYDSICKEIGELRNFGVSFERIKNKLKEKYPDYNAGTLIIKYYERKEGK